MIESDLSWLGDTPIIRGPLPIATHLWSDQVRFSTQSISVSWQDSTESCLRHNPGWLLLWATPLAGLSLELKVLANSGAIYTLPPSWEDYTSSPLIIQPLSNAKIVKYQLYLRILPKLSDWLPEIPHLQGKSQIWLQGQYGLAQDLKTARPGGNSMGQMELPLPLTSRPLGEQSPASASGPAGPQSPYPSGTVYNQAGTTGQTYQLKFPR